VKLKMFRIIIILLTVLVSSYAIGIPIQTLMNPKVTKAKLYFGDTVFLIWFDRDGDGQCDQAFLYEKSGESYIFQPLPCERADQMDMIMEPRV
jgi:hypothetical protein